MERERLQDYTGNGERATPTFSDAEMRRRLDGIRAHMAASGIDAALFTSYHCINYYSDFLYCQFGRRYGLLVDHDISTSISAGIDGGQPWRRTFGGKNVTYTDWRKDNYFHAIRGLTAGVKRLGIEFDHVTIDTLALLKAEFPEMEFVDIAAPSMRLRMIKSAEEIALIEKMTRIADIGGAACVEAIAVGVPEHEIALHSTATMVREIAQGLARRRASRHVDLVPVRHQHRRRPQPRHVPQADARRHPLAQLLPDGRRLLRRPRTHAVLRGG